MNEQFQDQLVEAGYKAIDEAGTSFTNGTKCIRETSTEGIYQLGTVTEGQPVWAEETYDEEAAFTALNKPAELSGEEQLEAEDAEQHAVAGDAHASDL